MFADCSDTLVSMCLASKHDYSRDFMSCFHKKKSDGIIVSQEESMCPFSKTEWMKPEREEGSRLATGSACRPMYVC